MIACKFKTVWKHKIDKSKKRLKAGMKCKVVGRKDIYNGMEVTLEKESVFGNRKQWEVYNKKGHALSFFIDELEPLKIKKTKCDCPLNIIMTSGCANKREHY